MIIFINMDGYDNKCYISCPNGTIYNSSNKICQEDKKMEIKTTSEVKRNTTIKDERDEDIQNFRNNVYDYNISESKEDKIEVKNGVVYQVTTSDNQKNNIYKNKFKIFQH